MANRRGSAGISGCLFPQRTSGAGMDARGHPGTGPIWFGESPCWPLPGWGHGVTIFADSVRRNHQFPGDAQKETPGTLSRRTAFQRACCLGAAALYAGADGLTAVFGRNVEIPTDGHGSRGRRLLRLGPAETLLAINLTAGTV